MLLRVFSLYLLAVCSVSAYSDVEDKNYPWKKSFHRSFTIDHENNCFLKDGVPFRYISGSIHYFRVHPADWADRLAKMKYAGLNAIQVYVEWGSHEPEPGQFDFTGGRDLTAFLIEAQNQGLLVILRVGPYICAEREMGGFPYWLLRLYPNIRLRTSDSDYMGRVRIWLLKGLFPRIRPLLYHNGGPVIMAQIENEYGNFYACDYSYTSALRRIFKEGLGDEIVLFTTDNGSPSALKCGKIPLVYATVDFGVNANPLSEFYGERLFEPSGPLVNSEFYSGWLDHWGEPRHKVNTSDFVGALDKILSLKASVNIYMFHGGTNFGFSAGADEARGHYTSCLTSYDYDAPLSEAGDMTHKFEAVRQVIGKYLPLPKVPAPSNSSKEAYGRVLVSRVGSHISLASDGLLESVHTTFPLTFEQLRVFSGIVIYSTIVNFSTPDPSLLNLGAVHDRGYVLLNGVLKGVVSRSLSTTALPVRIQPGDKLVVVVESLGRINVGTGINDFKGLASNVTLQSKVLTNWTMTPLPLTDYDRLNSALTKLRIHSLMSAKTKADIAINALDTTGFYMGTFEVPVGEQPRDTFLRFDHWTKGVAWINDFCLGRYWPAMGPQNTLYVPHGTLKLGTNEVLLLELEGASGCEGNTWLGRHLNSDVNLDTAWGWMSDAPNARSCSVEFVDTPDIDAPVPL